MLIGAWHAPAPEGYDQLDDCVDDSIGEIFEDGQ